MKHKILDLSAGYRAMWFDKKHPLATFVDHRAEVKPDVVADTRKLGKRIGTGYTLVVFDPPHSNFGKNSQFSKRYGYTPGAEIAQLIIGTAEEARRVSAPGALMVLKWNDRDRKLDSVLKMMAPWWEPLFGQIVAQRRRRTKGLQLSATWWVLLLRKEESAC